MYAQYSQFLNNWNNPNHQFKLNTSGSTGAAKELFLERSLMEYSATLTRKAISGIENQKALCCLPTNKMGGFMQLVRATLWNAEIKINKPSLNPLESVGLEHDFRNISLSPPQLISILEDENSLTKLLQFNTILIGGAALANNYIEQLISTKHNGFFLTYGMTETYSHIALRHLPKTGYKILGGIKYKIESSGVLTIKSPLTNNKWLKTQDLVKEIDRNLVDFWGRNDNVINSGGLKFSAEEMEKCIFTALNIPFYIGATVDNKLGEAITLFIEKLAPNKLEELNIILEGKFGKHSRIKRVKKVQIKKDPITGKIQRKHSK